jgi:hypothetical protein
MGRTYLVVLLQRVQVAPGLLSFFFVGALQFEQVRVLRGILRFQGLCKQQWEAGETPYLRPTQ